MTTSGSEALARALDELGALAKLPFGDPGINWKLTMAPEKAPNAASGVQYTQGPDASPDERSRGRREVERRKAEELSYEQFVWNYMAANKPVLIQGACECWNSRADWVLEDGSVDLEQLCQLYGGARVAVTDTNSDGEYGDMESTEMTLAQYIAWWRSGAPGRQPQMLYLKDWHFVAQFGAQYQAYRVPHFFRSDWLNSWYDSMRNAHPAPSFQETEQKDPVFDAGAPESPHLSPSGDPLSALDDSQQTRHPDGIRNGTGTGANGDVSTSDYRFVYLGPAGTRTPLHSDVLRSFSWSANVAGRKLWRLLPPEHTHMLYDRHLRHHATDFFPAAEDACRFPRLSEAKDLVLEVVQEAGEVLFVPSGWHHTVVNLEDTLSINHNWLNAYNLHWSTAFLLRELAATTNALQDCRAGCGSSSEYEELVQRALGANVSMDLDSFSQLLRHASRSCRRCLASQQQQQHLVGLQAEHGCGAAPSLSTSCLEADIEAGLWSWEAALGLARSAGALQVLCRRMRARHGDLTFQAAFSGPLSWVHEAEAEAAEAVAALAVVGLEIPEQWGHMFDEVLAQEVAL